MPVIEVRKSRIKHNGLLIVIWPFGMSRGENEKGTICILFLQILIFLLCSSSNIYGYISYCVFINSFYMVFTDQR